MIARSLIPRLSDTIEAIERVNGVVADVSRSHGARVKRIRPTG